MIYHFFFCGIISWTGDSMSKKNIDNIKYVLLSICTFFSFGIDINTIFNMEFDVIHLTDNYSNFLNNGILGSFLIFVFIYIIFKKYYRVGNKYTKILAFLFSVFMIFGKSYMLYGNTDLIFGNFLVLILSIIAFVGYYSIFRLCLDNLFDILNRKRLKESTNKILVLFKKHPFIFSLIVILLCWLPYIIAFYPIILSPDPTYQIKQFFGIYSKYNEISIPLDKSVLITNHHPVLHTLLIGGCLKLGTIIGNDNLGLFFYSFIQLSFLAITLAYTIKYMITKMNLNNIIAFLLLIFYSLVPLFPLYSMSGVKDVIFSTFVIWFLICMHKVLSSKECKFNIGFYLLFLFVMIMITLFRNNGIFLIILTFPFLIFAMKKQWKIYLFLFVSVFVFNACYNNIILPAFKVTPGSIREALSIPFQQSARVVKYYGDELDVSDINAIDKILTYDSLGDRYNPELADPVKDEFNKYANSKDLLVYFKSWSKLLFKYPVTYINATVNNTYGYFYPEKNYWYIYYRYNDRIVRDDGFDYHFNSLEKIREKLTVNAMMFPKYPVIGLLANVGFYTWLVFIMLFYSMYTKNFKKIVLYLPALVSILVCVASPANTYFRYVLPYVFSMPLMIGILFDRKI